MIDKIVTALAYVFLIIVIPLLPLYRLYCKWWELYGKWGEDRWRKRCEGLTEAEIHNLILIGQGRNEDGSYKDKK